MMAMQKEREHHYLRKAQAAYPDLPQGSPMASESPDFLFANESRVLGIEMTDFVRRIKRDSPLTLRTIESLHGMVASEAKSRFEAKHGIPLWIALHWDDRFKFSKRDVMRIASQLVDVIESDIPHVPYDGTSFNWESHGGLARLRGPTRISVRRLKDRTKCVWAKVEAGFIGGTISDIQEIVEAKEPKVQTYLTKCDEVWLLIVADGAHISSTLDLDDPRSVTRIHLQTVSKDIAAGLKQRVQIQRLLIERLKQVQDVLGERIHIDVYTTPRRSQQLSGMSPFVQNHDDKQQW